MHPDSYPDSSLKSPGQKVNKPQNYKAKLGFLLFGLGLLGVLSLLTQPLPLDNLPPEVLQQIPPDTLRYLVLINPTVLLLLAVVVGTLLHDKVRLGAPALEGFLTNRSPSVSFPDQVKATLIWGLIGGLLALGIGALFTAYLPQEFVELGQKLQLTPLTRLLYGGITEEILIRFGLMTFIVWVGAKIAKNLPPAIYWAGILLTSLLFALGHFPVAYQAVGDPSPMLLLYILLGNSVLGILYGWLYWRKGLEAAIMAHMLTHVVVLVGGLLVV